MGFWIVFAVGLSMTLLAMVLALRVKALEQALHEHEFSFELRHAADLRAIARWRSEVPGRDLQWPDHADMVVYLMDQWDHARMALDGAYG